MNVTAEVSPARSWMKAHPYVLVTMFVIVLGALWWVKSHNAPHESPYSALTSEQILTDWPGADVFPLFVPEQLPSGARTTDGPGFTLSNVVVDPEALPKARVWVSYYDSEVLGGAAFRVFQRPHDIRSDHPCGPMPNVDYLQRTVIGGTVTICSTQMNDPKAKTYWENVPLTATVDKVSWIVD